MAIKKQKEIPVTSFIQPYPVLDNSILTQWGMAVATFCQGIQSVKNNDNILSLRIGNLVYIQGPILLSNGTTQSILPIIPRTDGFITGYDSAGNVTSIAITINSKEIAVTKDLYINGLYIAQTKEK